MHDGALVKCRGLWNLCLDYKKQVNHIWRWQESHQLQRAQLGGTLIIIPYKIF